MAIIRCPQGHYYDDKRFSTCPHCGIRVNVGNPEEPKMPETKRGGLFGWLDREKTVAYSETRAEASAGESDRTISLEAAMAAAEDDQRTIGMYSAAKGNDYVTGWLVCIKGPEKGRDYRLHHGFNRVGRDLDMDVSIVEDSTITRKNHCSVVYDDRKNQFSLVPSSGPLTYYHNELLTEAKILQAGDEIQIGNSVFEFIPFCRKGRVWESGEQD